MVRPIFAFIMPFSAPPRSKIHTPGALNIWKYANASWIFMTEIHEEGRAALHGGPEAAPVTQICIHNRPRKEPRKLVGKPAPF